jgi:hypothetical protein
MNQTDFSKKIVMSYLIHNGYSKTAILLNNGTENIESQLYLIKIRKGNKLKK